MRLDAYLANAGLGSRSQVKEFLKQKRIVVDGTMVKDFGYKVDENKQVVEFDGKIVDYKKYRYYILNKPADYITATEDKRDKTVMDLLDIPNKKDFFPVGRLDKDSEGLLLITNDGEMSHSLLSPKKHVPKVYYADVEGALPEDAVNKFKEGLVLGDGYQCLPAELKITSKALSGSPLGEGAKSSTTPIHVTIQEGKFHQVKRMFEAVGCKVVYLKRIAMGRLWLDEELKLGEYRELDEEELKLLKD